MKAILRIEVEFAETAEAGDSVGIIKVSDMTPAELQMRIENGFLNMFDDLEYMSLAMFEGEDHLLEPVRVHSYTVDLVE